MQRTIRYLALILGIATAGMVAAMPQERGVRLPDMGGSAHQVFTDREEQDYARGLEQYLRNQGLLIEDPQIAEFFTDMGYRLASRSDEPQRNYRFVILRDRSVNAFAAPGGFIATHAGLVLAADRESEVAGVLAHEIAHVTQNHLARRVEDSQETSLPIMLASMGLALAAGMAGADAEVGQGLIMSGTALAQQMQINYTRQNEYEADRIGIGMLNRAGYDPRGVADMFAKMNVLNRAYGEGPPEYLRTHPLSTTRIAEAKDRARDMPRPADADSLQFRLMQARLRVMVEPYPKDALQYFEARLDKSDDPHPEANQYGMAMAHIRDGAHDKAASLVESLLDKRPDSRIYKLLHSELLLAQNRVDQAINLLGDLHARFTGNHIIALHYAKALLHENDSDRAQQAAEVLRSQLREHARDAQLHALYAKAADRAGQPIRAAEAVAEAYYLRGSLNEAIVQLERLSRRDDLDYYQRSRISARLSELRAERTVLHDRGRGIESDSAYPGMFPDTPVYR